MFTSHQKMIVITHEMFYGVPHALRDFLLKKKVDMLIFIGLPMVEQKYATLSMYQKGKLSFQKKILQITPGLFSYIVDFFITIYWILKQKEVFDTYIAVDVLNSFTGLVLKKVGKVKKVIFYAVDFTPKRFKNSILNSIFHLLESLSVKNADEVWNVSPKIAEGREKLLHISEKKYPQKVVPSGIWNEKVKKFPFSQIKKHQLLFLGHLLEKQGLQMVLEATPQIIKRIPTFTFAILGGGEYEMPLKRLAEKLHIQKYIQFKGWIRDRKIVDTTLGESAAAIAVYKPEKEKLYNFTYYADPIKLKEYLASGLPVIITDVPHNAREIQEKGCGVLVQYKKEDIAHAIIKILSDQSELKKYRNNAIKYAKEYDWDRIFSKAFS